MLDLMLFDETVLSFDRRNGEVKVWKPELLPFGLFLEESDEFDDRINNRSVFDHWCGNRTLSLDRKHAKMILNYFGLKQAVTDSDRADVALAVRALTLTDCYWLKGRSETVQWKDVNLYENHLNEALFDVALSGTLSVSNDSLVTAEITTKGVFPKAWQRTSDGFVLYKGNVDDSVNKEVEACAILKELGFHPVEYRKTQWGGETVSTCACITGPEYSIATAESVFLTCAARDESFEELVKKYEFSYDIMNLADYLIGNTDRHQENWGFGFSPKGRTLIDLHPLMDFNHSFEATEKTECLPERLCRGRQVTQEDVAFEVICKYPELRHRLNAARLDTLSKYTYGSYVSERLSSLERRYEKKMLRNREREDYER